LFLTNALPIVGGIVLYHAGGALGALRAVAFACVIAGAVAVARREAEPPAPAEPEAHPAADPDAEPAPAVV